MALLSGCVSLLGSKEGSRLLTCGLNPGGKVGLGSSMWVMLIGKNWAFGSIYGSEGIRDGLFTCVDETAICCDVDPSSVPDSWLVVWYTLS